MVSLVNSESNDLTLLGVIDSRKDGGNGLILQKFFEFLRVEFLASDSLTGKCVDGNICIR